MCQHVPLFSVLPSYNVAAICQLDILFVHLACAYGGSLLETHDSKEVCVAIIRSGDSQMLLLDYSRHTIIKPKSMKTKSNILSLSLTEEKTEH